MAGHCNAMPEGENLHVISKRYTQRIERHNLNLRQHLAQHADGVAVVFKIGGAA